MHYFKRNIGDYAKKAGRLSMLQHGAFTLLQDACYDREQFPTLEEAIEWTWASTTEETEAVAFVLRKFFELEDGRYVQKEIQADIDQYHANAETNKRIALEREAKRKGIDTNRAPGVNEPPPNQEPLTKNHKPKKKKTTPAAGENYSMRKELLAGGVAEQIVDDWLAVRKLKKLANTSTAMEGVLRQVALAGLTLEAALKICCERGWGGFMAKWVLNPDPIQTGFQAQPAFVAKPILPVEEQVPSLKAVVRSPKPEGIGDLGKLVKKREEAP